MKRCYSPLLCGMVIASLHAQAMDSAHVNADRFFTLFRNHPDSLHAPHVHAIATMSDVVHAWHEATPSQARGPFYPRPLPRERDTDLTIKNSGHEAQGLKVQVQGQVMDRDGTVIPGATIEIWQACAAGSYDHPDDPIREDAPRDPNFQYYGVDRTGADGQYAFKTIVPGAYPASDGWVRPPHIHMQVSAPGHKTLITQLYFKGDSFTGPVSNLNGDAINGVRIDELNAADRLLNSVAAGQRSRLIVGFSEQEGIMLGVFNIYLKRQ